MRELRYTLISDGSSDRALIPIINWVLKHHFPKTAIQAEWADFRNLPKPPKTLMEKIQKAVELYPCDVLFIHRDAENQGSKLRFSEIDKAIQASEVNINHVPVVPIRMQEAWLLIDENALRQAAGNPKGSEKIEFPKIKMLESMPDPKNKLYGLLRQASGLKGRNLKKFNVTERIFRLAELITNFGALRGLSAFNQLESDVKKLSVSK
jgi:hypothetical protein